MMVKALIVEQLEVDGKLRTLRMQPGNYNSDIVVAFADEYEDHRIGPFHFLDDQDARRFSEGFANCKLRKVGSRRFYQRGDIFHVELGWAGIPTERNWLSYYAVSLPEFAVPITLSVWDPHMPERQYRRTVTRDNQRHRYIIYLECTSSRGAFDFDLSCDFKIDEEGFLFSDYHDKKTTEYGSSGDDWKNLLPHEEQEKVVQFFVKDFNLHKEVRRMKNKFEGPVGVVAENARDFVQHQHPGQSGTELKALAEELAKLRIAARQQSTEADHDAAVGAIAEAESAAKKGDEKSMIQYLAKAGSWALDVATKIGVSIAAEAIKKSLGMGK
jgi:hypothetical protein